MIYSIKQAFKQFIRNRAMVSASIFSISAILLVLGCFFLLVVNISNLAEETKKNFDTIEIFLLDETEKSQAEDMMKNLVAMKEVKDVKYKTAEEALNEFKVRFGDKAYTLDNLKENPLPNSIVVKVDKLEYANKVVGKAKKFQGIETVNYYKDTMDKLIKIIKTLQTGAMAIVLVLVIISVIVVSNTIKLTVLAREREISIMKYVGATNWFIRGPFLIEGILIGLVSAGISVGIISFIYMKTVELYGRDILVMLQTNPVPEFFMIKNLVLIFVALGVSIGACGSIISMRRFLDR